MKLLLELLSAATAAGTLWFLLDELGIWQKLVMRMRTLWARLFPVRSINWKRLELERAKRDAGVYDDDIAPAGA